MTTPKISVSPQDMLTTLRNQASEITELRLMLASVQRQLVEAQAALAAEKGDKDGEQAQETSEEQKNDAEARS